MGIIEKAVDQHGSRKDRRVTPSPPARRANDAPPPGHTPVKRADDKPGLIAQIHNAANAGLTSMEENPSLAQDFRFLKRPLLSQLFRPSDAEDAVGHVVLVTSDLPGAGKSFVSLNLAASIAREQLTKVVLIDADPLRRNLTTALGMEAQPGLLEVLVDRGLRADQYALNSDYPSLRFIPAGQPCENSTELLASRRLAQVLKELDDPDTVVLLDSPPLLLTSEARVLVERADHTLVVVEAGRTSLNDVSAVFKIIGETASDVSFVLNKAPSSNHGHEAGYYGYGYDYGHGQGN